MAAIKKLTVISVSEWLTQETAQSLLHKKRLVTINNGVDTEIFQPMYTSLRNEMNIGDKFVVVGMANKWLSKVNHDLLEELLESLSEDIRIILVGCTDQQKKELCDNRIITLGYMKEKKELATIYSSADVFVNLTYEDSFPTVNLESLACGTPVITNRTTGASETIDEQTGVLVTPGNVVELVNAINAVHMDGSISREKCRQRVLQHFEKEKCYKKYIDEYRK